MNPFAQNLLWVFRVAECGGAELTVALAKRLGAGLIVKYHDGDPTDDAKWGFQEQFRACLKVCQQQGVPLIAWGYCYGDKYGRLLKEAAAAAQALKEGAAGYVIDAEIEWEVPQGGDWAKRFLEAVHAEVPDAGQRLAYAPFWNMRWHPRYPAREFSQGCCAVMPQVYYTLAQKPPAQVVSMWQITLEDFTPFGLPIYPIGQFSGATLEQVLAFLGAIGDRPRSWWLLDKASAEMLDAAFPDPWRQERERLLGQVADLKRRLAQIRDLAEVPPS